MPGAGWAVSPWMSQCALRPLANWKFHSDYVLSICLRWDTSAQGCHRLALHRVRRISKQPFQKASCLPSAWQSLNNYSCEGGQNSAWIFTWRVPHRCETISKKVIVQQIWGNKNNKRQTWEKSGNKKCVLLVAHLDDLSTSHKETGTVVHYVLENTTNLSTL